MKRNELAKRYRRDQAVARGEMIEAREGETLRISRGVAEVIPTGCVCKPGAKTCAYHATINRIIDSGVSLEDRLAVVDHSTIIEHQHEAAIIRAALRAKRWEENR